MISEERYNYFEVIGAGQLQISHSANWKCGGKIGFSFGVQWGRNGYTGGIISREEAVLLAEYILNTIEDKTKLRKRKLNNINKLIKKEV